jgi:hypothetical protein
MDALQHSTVSQAVRLTTLSPLRKAFATRRSPSNLLRHQERALQLLRNDDDLLWPTVTEPWPFVIETSEYSSWPTATT